MAEEDEILRCAQDDTGRLRMTWGGWDLALHCPNWSWRDPEQIEG